MAKKSKSKFNLQGELFGELFENLDKLGGDIKGVAEDCLKKAHENITSNVHSAMTKHHRTGETERSIQDNSSVKWDGNLASIEIGFNLKQGGMPSIFLMYGTPRMKKDVNLYNAIYGNKAKKQNKKDQEEILRHAIESRLGG